MSDDDKRLGALIDAALNEQDAGAYEQLTSECGPTMVWLAAALNWATGQGDVPCALILAPDPTSGRWQVLGASRDPSNMPYLNVLAERIRNLIDELAKEDDAEVGLAGMPSEGTA